MKSLMMIAVLLSASAQAATYTCTGTAIRSGNHTPARALFKFQLNAVDALPVMSDFKGVVTTSDNQYPFVIKGPITARVSTRASKYMDYFKFDGISSNGSTQWGAQDYGFMGYLVVAKVINSAGKVTAHYVFNADQSGGTIDLACSVTSTNL